MAKKQIKKVTFTPSVKANESDILAEIDAVRNVIEIKKNQTNTDNFVSEEKIKELEGGNKTETSEVVNSNETVTETLDATETKTETTEIPKRKISVLDDMINSVTQEDIDKKVIADNGGGADTVSEKTNIESRLESASVDDFVTNEGATEEEDTPEYRREMAKIKASALVEFFDVVFMLICLGISKDFSDNAQTKFSLVKERKNAIKANVFQILAFSKKKHNPMGTVVFLILFSYVPLIAIAIMQRVKRKKEEQQKAIEEAERLSKPVQFVPDALNYNIPQFEPPVKRKYTTNKIKTVHAETNQEVKLMKDGSYKNVETGAVYKGGRGRKPEWVKKYIGKIG